MISILLKCNVKNVTILEKMFQMKDVTLPKVPASINADLMTADEICEKLMEGYNGFEKGNVHEAFDAFKRFREMYNE